MMLPREINRPRHMSSGGFSSAQPRRPVGPHTNRPVSAATPLSPLSQNLLTIRRTSSGQARSGASSASASRPSCSVSGSFQPAPTTPGAHDEKVRVAVRCRPPNPTQGEHCDDVIVSMNPASNEVFVLDQEATPWRVDTPLWSCAGLARDGTPSASQADVYNQLGRPLLLHALEGYNSTLMAYGQTGSGKTYTMMGDTRDGDGDEGAGVIPRLCRDLFQELNCRTIVAPTGERLSWEVHVRYVEVYCEKISDLLNCGASVSVREEITPQSANFVLVGARRVKVTTTDDLLQALAVGNRWRRTAATKLNDRSSRSHAIFVIDLTEVLSFVEPDGTVASAPSKSLSIRLVDLAGSERVSETGVHGQQLKEVKDINLSLFTLGCVIECLSDPKRRGIKPPYRDSVLTKLLRDAFGGNSKTTMVCTISPCEAQRGQTVQTLHYAAKARHVLNKPRVKEDPSAMELRRANEELIALRLQLEEAQRNGNHYGSIEAELQEANERLRREQRDAKLRRQVMERREAELAARLRELEDQREAYEAQMLALEAEAERTRVQQEKRERDLRRAHEQAADYARDRLKEMEEQRVRSEVALRNKEEELQRQQRAIEEKLKTAETQARARIDELQRQQRDTEKALQEKERLASMREREVRQKHAQAEDELRAMERRTFEMEEEWAAKVKALEAAARQREQEVELRTREAQGALCKAEASARRKEEEMERQWREADHKARLLQSEVAAKEAELQRRVQEATAKAELHTGELNERLRKAEYELTRRAQEAAQQQLDLDTLRRAAALQSETALAKERSADEALNTRAAALQALEAQLRQREEEQRQHFEEVLAMKREANEQRLEQQRRLQAEHEVALQAVTAREAALTQQVAELRRESDERAGKVRAQEMQLERQQMELLAGRNEFEVAMQNDRRAILRSREEMQLAQDRRDTECKLRQDRLNELESELRARRLEMETAHKEREAALRQRESAATQLQDAAMTKEVALYQAQERLKAEQAELQRRATAAERVNDRLETNVFTSLQRLELRLRGSDVDDGSTLGAVRMAAELNAVQGHAGLSSDALNLREQRYFYAFESMYRANILAEARTEFRSLVRTNQLEVRDIKRIAALAEAREQADELRAKLDEAVRDERAAAVQASASAAQVETLVAELDGVRRQAMEVKVQLGSALSAAKVAEAQVRQVRVEAYETEARLRDREQASEAALIDAQASAAATARRQEGLMAFTKRLLEACEEEERSLLEHHQTTERQSLHLLQIADRRVHDRELAIRRWQSLYRRRGEEDVASRVADDAARLQRMDDEAQRLRAQQRAGETLTRREDCLAAEKERFDQRVLDFESYQRAQSTELARQESEVKKYLLEMEEMDQRKMREYAERERALVEMAERLKVRHARARTHAQDMYESLLQRSVEQQSALAEVQEELERMSLQRAKYMERERELMDEVQHGNVAAMAELIQLHEECVEADKKALRRRARKVGKEEARSKQRLAEQEAQIHRYLLELEEEDIRRAALTQQGQELMREAEGRLAQAQFKEAAIRDLARQVRLDAMESEEKARAMETTLRREERTTRERQKHRKVELEQRQRAANSAAEYNERTLLDLEADLLAVVNKNKDAEHVIKTREDEIKRQKLYYTDLSKMLAERDAMLRKEHARRLCSTENAGALATDLLDVNDALRRQVAVWKQKFDVLLSDGKVECEKCSWRNKKEVNTCLCCGHSKLLDLTEVR